MDKFKNYNFGDIQALNFVSISSQEKEMIRQWRNDEKIRVWMFRPKIISIKEHDNFINKLIDDDQNLYWLVVNKSSNEYYGVINLNNIDSINKNAYVGIYLNPEKIKSGIGHIIFNLLKKIAFEKIKLHTLKLQVIENNHRAIKFYKKSGFIKEGLLKDYIIKNNSWVNVIIMGIINNRTF